MPHFRVLQIADLGLRRGRVQTIRYNGGVLVSNPLDSARVTENPELKEGTLNVSSKLAFAYNIYSLMDGFGSFGSQCTPSGGNGWACTNPDGSMIGTFISSKTFMDPLPRGVRIVGYSLNLGSMGGTLPGFCDQTKTVTEYVNGVPIITPVELGS